MLERQNFIIRLEEDIRAFSGIGGKKAVALHRRSELIPWAVKGLHVRERARKELPFLHMRMVKEIAAEKKAEKSARDQVRMKEIIAHMYAADNGGNPQGVASEEAMDELLEFIFGDRSQPEQHADKSNSKLRLHSLTNTVIFKSGAHFIHSIKENIVNFSNQLKQKGLGVNFPGRSVGRR